MEENMIIFAVQQVKSAKAKEIRVKDFNQETDLIKSFNFLNGDIVYLPLSKRLLGNREIWEIELESDEIIKCVDNRKWYILRDGAMYIDRTDNLSTNDMFLDPITLEGIKIKDVRNTYGDLPVYDIRVEKTNNYFVGINGNILTTL